MPTNKNALIRYKYLDRLLSDHHHYYDIHDLTEQVNTMLYDDGFPEVTQRCIPNFRRHKPCEYIFMKKNYPYLGKSSNFAE